jgi:hypothetical protein
MLTTLKLWIVADNVSDVASCGPNFLDGSGEESFTGSGNVAASVSSSPNGSGVKGYSPEIIAFPQG